jgi:hypothetical protein
MAPDLDNDLSTTPRGSTPVPDPTELTDRAIARVEKSIKDYVDSQLSIRDERLRGIDTATDLRLQRSEQYPAAIDEKVGHVRELARAWAEADSRFAAAEVLHLREVDDIRFQAAERLAARESELNALALAAAFAAQKEASAKEAEYTRIASIKSESATAQAIDKLGELFATQTRGLGDKVDDLKDRVGRIESVKVGSVEQRGDAALSRTSIYATIGVVVSLLLVGIAVVGVLATRV